VKFLSRLAAFVKKSLHPADVAFASPLWGFLFRYNRHENHVGSSKAAGKSTKEMACAGCTAAKERAKVQTRERNEALDLMCMVLCILEMYRGTLDVINPQIATKEKEQASAPSHTKVQ
jgi:hypothetical protein